MTVIRVITKTTTTTTTTLNNTSVDTSYEFQIIV